MCLLCICVYNVIAHVLDDEVNPNKFYLAMILTIKIDLKL